MIEIRKELICTVVILLGGCGAPNLALVPDAPVEMSGRWFLDTAASDNTVASVRDAIKKIRRDPYPSMLPTQTGATLDGLREALPPDDATWLDIRQTRMGFTIDYSGLKKASYRNGQNLTVFDSAGTGELTSGWSGDKYVIYNEYESAFTLRQQFQLEGEAGRLLQTIEIKSSRLKHKVIIHRYYNSGSS